MTMLDFPPDTQDLGAVNDWLNRADPVEIADELARLSPAERAVPFRLLAKDRALEVFEMLDPLHQQELLQGLREESVRQLFADMDPDDRARLVDEMPAKVAKQLLGGLSPRERSLTATLLGYPENSAGRVMSPEVVNLRANQTVGDALARLRRIGASAETIYALPVTDEARRLVGALGLRDLVLADPDKQIGELMDTEVYSGRVDDDQEQVARLIQEADLLALPIVDTEDRLVGIVTVDDAMQILEEEQTEDVARAGGAEPLSHPYLSVSVLGIARTRIVWLMVLIVAASLTVNVLNIFESTLAAVVALAAFIPLVIGTGGNAGSQAATTVTRALAVGELRHLGRVAGRAARDACGATARDDARRACLRANAAVRDARQQLARSRAAHRRRRVADLARGLHAGDAGRLAAAAAGASPGLRPGRHERALHLDPRRRIRPGRLLRHRQVPPRHLRGRR